MVITAIFVFGLIIGSFLNAVIWRLHSGKSILAASSECPACGHSLSFLDLVPVVSFFALGRKCRYCKRPISWQYPLVEIFTGLAFVLIALPPPFLPHQWGGIEGGGLATYYLLLTTCFLLLIFVYDLKHYLILDKVVFPAALLALLYQGYQGNWTQALIGAAALSGFFGFLYFVSRGRWIGFGDVKLGVFLGFLVPWPQTIVLFFLAYFLGALVSVPLLLAARKKWSSRLPFGAFLTVAAFVAMLWGEGIMSWYLSLIGIQ